MILFNKKTFSSLKHRDFRCFIIGQSMSLIGTFMQKTAQSWLLYSITKSAFLLGLLGVFQFGPMLIFSVFIGALVDKFPKKKLLYFTQGLGMFQAFLLFVLVYTKHVNYIYIYVLAVIYGISQAVDMPTRQSYFIELVGKKDLTNAISLNSTITNLAKILGPSLAGVVMIKFGMDLCFFLNFLSYVAVLIGIFLIKAEGRPVSASKKNLLGEVKAGFKYVKSSHTLVSTIIIMAIVCTFSMNIDVVVPVFSKATLGRGADGYTFILSCMGVGSLIGAVWMAGRKRENINMKLLKTAAFVAAVPQILAAIFKNFYASSILVLIAGMGIMIFLNTGNSTLQLNTSNEYRGRVMSIYSLLNQGTTPIGNVFAGTVMNNFGAPSGFFMCGAVSAAMTVAFCIFRNDVKVEKVDIAN